MAALSLADSNWGVLMLGQALFGKISPNFRMVGFRFADARWTIRAVLRAEDALDREAIEEAGAYFWANLESLRERLTVAWTDVVTEVVVSGNRFDMPSGQTDDRLVFLMRRSE